MLMTIVGFIIGFFFGLVIKGDWNIVISELPYYLLPAPKKQFHHSQNVIVFKGFYKGKKGTVFSHNRNKRYYFIETVSSSSFPNKYEVHYKDIKSDGILESSVIKSLNEL